MRNQEKNFLFFDNLRPLQDFCSISRSGLADLRNKLTDSRNRLTILRKPCKRLSLSIFAFVLCYTTKVVCPSWRLPHTTNQTCVATACQYLKKDRTLGVAADETKVRRSIGNLSVTMTEKKRLDVSF